MHKLNMTYIDTTSDQTKLLYNNNEGGRKPIQLSSKVNRDISGDMVTETMKGYDRRQKSLQPDIRSTDNSKKSKTNFDLNLVSDANYQYSKSLYGNCSLKDGLNTKNDK